MFEHIFENLSLVQPVVHCITNFVTVNDCANIILACGGSPTMAHFSEEVAEITSKTQSLVLNMGTLHDTDAMLIAGAKSNELHHPVILDPVGVGASTVRTQTFQRLSDGIRFSVIRGNISEIKKIGTDQCSIKGVDAGREDMVTESNVSENMRMAMDLSKKLHSVIAVSGPIDIVTDGNKTYLIRNGHPIMSKVTGTGCMSTALIGAFCGANPQRILEATAAAVAVMGIAGEIAYEKTEKEEGGTMTFRMYLIDCISRMTPSLIHDRMKLELRL